jgi:hypothetical protein
MPSHHITSQPSPTQSHDITEPQHAHPFLHWQVAEGELLRLSNKQRFILEVIAGSLRVSNRKKADIEADLTAGGYDKLPATGTAKVTRASHACYHMSLVRASAAGTLLVTGCVLYCMPQARFQAATSRRQSHAAQHPIHGWMLCVVLEAGF